MKKGSRWKPPKHSGLKEQIIQQYLRVWFTALTKKSSKVVYVDGFAGPGYFEEINMVGSPLIAIDEAAWALERHSQAEIDLIFVERDPETFKQLERNVQGKLKELSQNIAEKLNIRLLNSDFESAIGDLLESNYEFPMFVFIDPFGVISCDFSIAWIDKIMRKPYSEVLLNFLVVGLERHRRNLTAEQIKRIFGEVVDITKMSDRDIAETFRRIIKKRTGARVLIYAMANSRKKVQYYLLHITKDSRAVGKMKGIMRNLSGIIPFANVQAEQLTLFIPGKDEMLKVLVEKFGGKRVTFGKIKAEIADSDEYIWVEKEIRELLRELEKSGEIKVDNIKAKGGRRRKGTFPTDAIIIVPSGLQQRLL